MRNNKIIIKSYLIKKTAKEREGISKGLIAVHTYFFETTLKEFQAIELLISI